MSKKRIGLALMVIGAVLFWSVVLDPMLGLGVFAMIMGLTLYAAERVR